MPILGRRCTQNEEKSGDGESEGDERDERALEGDERALEEGDEEDGSSDSESSDHSTHTADREPITREEALHLESRGESPLSSPSSKSEKGKLAMKSPSAGTRLTSAGTNLLCSTPPADPPPQPVLTHSQSHSLASSSSTTQHHSQSPSQEKEASFSSSGIKVRSAFKLKNSTSREAPSTTEEPFFMQRQVSFSPEMVEDKTIEVLSSTSEESEDGVFSVGSVPNINKLGIAPGRGAPSGSTQPIDFEHGHQSTLTTEMGRDFKRFVTAKNESMMLPEEGRSMSMNTVLTAQMQFQNLNSISTTGAYNPFGGQSERSIEVNKTLSSGQQTLQGETMYTHKQLNSLARTDGEDEKMSSIAHSISAGKSIWEGSSVSSATQCEPGAVDYKKKFLRVLDAQKNVLSELRRYKLASCVKVHSVLELRQVLSEDPDIEVNRFGQDNFRTIEELFEELETLRSLLERTPKGIRRIVEHTVTRVCWRNLVLVQTHEQRPDGSVRSKKFLPGVNMTLGQTPEACGEAFLEKQLGLTVDHFETKIEHRYSEYDRDITGSFPIPSRIRQHEVVYKLVESSLSPEMMAKLGLPNATQFTTIVQPVDDPEAGDTTDLSQTTPMGKKHQSINRPGKTVSVVGPIQHFWAWYKASLVQSITSSTRTRSTAEKEFDLTANLDEVFGNHENRHAYQNLLLRMFGQKFELQKLTGGFSGSIVLRAQPYDIDMNPEEPCIVKLDTKAKVKEEVLNSNKVYSVLADRAAKVLGNPVFLDGPSEKESFGAFKLELAGACWQVPEFANHGTFLLSTFKDVYLYESAQHLLPKSMLSLGADQPPFGSVQWIMTEVMGSGGMLRTLAQKTVSRTLKKHLFEYYYFKGKDTQFNIFFNDQFNADAKEYMYGCYHSFFGTKMNNLREDVMNLNQYIAKRTEEGGPEAWADFVPLTCLCHGDLNASNIMVDAMDAVWMIDFATSMDLPFAQDQAKMETAFLFEYTTIPITLGMLLCFAGGLYANAPIWSEMKVEEWLGVPEEVIHALLFEAQRRYFIGIKNRPSITEPLSGRMTKYTTFVSFPFCDSEEDFVGLLKRCIRGQPAKSHKTILRQLRSRLCMDYQKTLLAMQAAKVLIDCLCLQNKDDAASLPVLLEDFNFPNTKKAADTDTSSVSHTVSPQFQHKDDSATLPVLLEDFNYPYHKKNTSTESSSVTFTAQILGRSRKYFLENWRVMLRKAESSSIKLMPIDGSSLILFVPLLKELYRIVGYGDCAPWFKLLAVYYCDILTKKIRSALSSWFDPHSGFFGGPSLSSITGSLMRINSTTTIVGTLGTYFAFCEQDIRTWQIAFHYSLKRRKSFLFESINSIVVQQLQTRIRIRDTVHSQPNYESGNYCEPYKVEMENPNGFDFVMCNLKKVGPAELETYLDDYPGKVWLREQLIGVCKESSVKLHLKGRPLLDFILMDVFHCGSHGLAEYYIQGDMAKRSFNPLSTSHAPSIFAQSRQPSAKLSQMCFKLQVEMTEYQVTAFLHSSSPIIAHKEGDRIRICVPASDIQPRNLLPSILEVREYYRCATVMSYLPGEGEYIIKFDSQQILDTSKKSVESDHLGTEKKSSEEKMEIGHDPTFYNQVPGGCSVFRYPPDTNLLVYYEKERRWIDARVCKPPSHRSESLIGNQHVVETGIDLTGFRDDEDQDASEESPASPGKSYVNAVRRQIAQRATYVAGGQAAKNANLPATSGEGSFVAAGASSAIYHSTPQTLSMQIPKRRHVSSSHLQGQDNLETASSGGTRIKRVKLLIDLNEFNHCHSEGMTNEEYREETQRMRTFIKSHHGFIIDAILQSKLDVMKECAPFRLFRVNPDLLNSIGSPNPFSLLAGLTHGGGHGGGSLKEKMMGGGAGHTGSSHGERSSSRQATSSTRYDSTEENLALPLEQVLQLPEQRETGSARMRAFVILGARESGKTCLCKRMSVNMLSYQTDVIPLIIPIALFTSVVGSKSAFARQETETEDGEGVGACPHSDAPASKGYERPQSVSENRDTYYTSGKIDTPLEGFPTSASREVSGDEQVIADDERNTSQYSQTRRVTSSPFLASTPKSDKKSEWRLSITKMPSAPKNMGSSYVSPISATFRRKTIAGDASRELIHSSRRLRSISTDAPEKRYDDNQTPKHAMMMVDHYLRHICGEESMRYLYLRNAIASHRLFFLFDDDNEAEALDPWVESCFITLASQCYSIIITCRQEAIEESFLLNFKNLFTILELQHLDQLQQRAIILSRLGQKDASQFRSFLTRFNEKLGKNDESKGEDGALLEDAEDGVFLRSPTMLSMLLCYWQKQRKQAIGSTQGGTSATASTKNSLKSMSKGEPLKELDVSISEVFRVATDVLIHRIQQRQQADRHKAKERQVRFHQVLQRIAFQLRTLNRRNFSETDPIQWLPLDLHDIWFELKSAIFAGQVALIIASPSHTSVGSTMRFAFNLYQTYLTASRILEMSSLDELPFTLTDIIREKGWSDVMEVLNDRSPERYQKLAIQLLEMSNWKPGDSEPPLHLAARYSHTPLFQVLKDMPPDFTAQITMKNDASMTPLHIAAYIGNAKICQLLIDNKAYVTAITKKGWTPLFFAVAEHNSEARIVLLKAFKQLDIHEQSRPYKHLGKAGLDLASRILDQGEKMTDAQFIRKVQNRFPEISYFRGRSDTTPDASANVGNVSPAEIEYKRKLNAMLSVFWICSDQHDKFVRSQAKDRLSEESWRSIVYWCREVVKLTTPEAVNAMLGFMAIHDLGKLSDFREDLAPGVYDHDVAITQIVDEYPQVLPSFMRLDSEYQELVATAVRVKFNFGQFLQGENLPANLTSMKDLLAVQGSEALAFYLFHIFVDMCGILGAHTLEGSKFMTETMYYNFRVGFDVLQQLGNTSPNETYDAFLRTRSVRQGIPMSGPHERAIIRLGCCCRVFTEDEGRQVKDAFESLPPDSMRKLTDFLNTDGIEKRPSFLLYYTPAFFENSKINPTVGVRRALMLLLKVYQLAAKEFAFSNTPVINIYIKNLASWAATCTSSKAFDNTYIQIMRNQDNIENSVIISPWCPNFDQLKLEKLENDSSILLGVLLGDSNKKKTLDLSTPGRSLRIDLELGARLMKIYPELGYFGVNVLESSPTLQNNAQKLSPCEEAFYQLLNSILSLLWLLCGKYFDFTRNQLKNEMITEETFKDIRKWILGSHDGERPQPKHLIERIDATIVCLIICYLPAISAFREDFSPPDGELVTDSGVLKVALSSESLPSYMRLPAKYQQWTNTCSQISFDLNHFLHAQKIPANLLPVKECVKIPGQLDFMILHFLTRLCGKYGHKDLNSCLYFDECTAKMTCTGLKALEELSTLSVTEVYENYLLRRVEYSYEIMSKKKPKDRTKDKIGHDGVGKMAHQKTGSPLDWYMDTVKTEKSKAIWRLSCFPLKIEKLQSEDGRPFPTSVGYAMEELTPDERDKLIYFLNQDGLSTSSCSASPMSVTSPEGTEEACIFPSSGRPTFHKKPAFFLGNIPALFSHAICNPVIGLTRALRLVLKCFLAAEVEYSDGGRKSSTEDIIFVDAKDMTNFVEGYRSTVSFDDIRLDIYRVKGPRGAGECNVTARPWVPVKDVEILRGLRIAGRELAAKVLEGSISETMFVDEAKSVFPELNYFRGKTDSTPDASASVVTMSPAEIEYRRTIGAMLSVYWVLADQHHRFVRGQAPEDRLTKQSWENLRHWATQIVNLTTPQAVDTMLCFMVLHDLGKMTHFREDLAPGYHDHDQALNYIISTAPDVLPSYQRLEGEDKSLIQASVNVTFNLGQFLQAENLPANLIAVKELSKHSENALGFYLFHIFADMSGILGAKTLEGSVFMTEIMYANFKRGLDVLHTLSSSSVEYSYDGFLQRRAILCFTGFTSEEHRSLVRLACCARVFTQDGGAKAQHAFMSLFSDERRRLCTYLNADGVLNRPGFLLYYAPAFLESCKNSEIIGLLRGFRMMLKIYESADKEFAGSDESIVTIYVDQFAREVRSFSVETFDSVVYQLQRSPGERGSFEAVATIDLQATAENAHSRLKVVIQFDFSYTMTPEGAQHSADGAGIPVGGGGFRGDSSPRHTQPKTQELLNKSHGTQNLTNPRTALGYMNSQDGTRFPLITAWEEKQETSIKECFELLKDITGLHSIMNSYSLWSRDGVKTNRYGKLVVVPDRYQDCTAFFFDESLELDNNGGPDDFGTCNLRDIDGQFVDFSLNGPNGFKLESYGKETTIRYSNRVPIVLVKTSINDALADEKYFTEIVARFSKPGEKLIINTSIKYTIQIPEIANQQDTKNQNPELIKESMSLDLINFLFNQIHFIVHKDCSFIYNDLEIQITKDVMPCTLHQFLQYMTAYNNLNDVMASEDKMWAFASALPKEFVSFKKGQVTLSMETAKLLHGKLKTLSVLCYKGLLRSWLELARKYYNTSVIITNSFDEDLWQVIHATLEEAIQIDDYRTVKIFAVNFNEWTTNEHMRYLGYTHEYKEEAKSPTSPKSCTQFSINSDDEEEYEAKIRRSSPKGMRPKSPKNTPNKISPSWESRDDDRSEKSSKKRQSGGEGGNPS